MFKRIICGVDESSEALEAVRQARHLAHPDAELLLVGVVDEAAAVHAGWAATAVLEDIRESEVAALTAARDAAAGHAETRLLRGVPWSSIAAAASEERGRARRGWDARSPAPGRNRRAGASPPTCSMRRPAPC